MSKEKAVDYFDRHKSSNECHITSDGRVFHTKGAADGFANGLKDNKIESYKRGEIDNVSPSDDSAEATATAIENLKSFDFENAKYPEAKSLSSALGLEPASQKFPDILEALKTAKANLEPKE